MTTRARNKLKLVKIRIAHTLNKRLKAFKNVNFGFLNKVELLILDKSLISEAEPVIAAYKTFKL